ncbi:MAG: hypothetical protein LQ351_006635 [Letrouitia transgressa]|nr:MAG: hypothetical protein LQ351_006635 [Letrouitia transgressa]
MSCPTAERWFAPTAEFEALIEDYALVDESADWVQGFFESYNNQNHFTEDAFARWESRPKTFGDVQFLSRRHCDLHIYNNHLIYADVNEADPKHKEALYDSTAREPALEVESEKARELRKKLVAEFSQAEVDRITKTKRGSQLDKDALFKQEKKLIEKDLYLDLGILYPNWFSYIMKAANIDGKKELLNIFSGQTKRKNPRPVMLLLGMVDKVQTEERGLTEGWNIAYDFIENTLIVKPFVSKPGHHPLGEKWGTDVASDGPSFCGTPLEFVNNFVKFSKDMEPKKAEEISESDAYTMLVHCHTAELIDHNSAGFKTVLASDDKSASDLVEEMNNASADLSMTMDNKKFELKKKTPVKQRGIDAFRELQGHLEASERELRDDAVDLKENGNDKLAQEYAQF